MLKEGSSKENNTPIDADATQCSETASEYSQDSGVVQSISMALFKLISSNKSQKIYKQKLKQQEKQIFTSKIIPPISLSDYLARILKYTKMEENTLIIALIYIDRICKKIFLNEFNVHRTFFASVILAIKFFEDKYYSNVFYAKVGGVTLEQLNALEHEFLSCIDFSLFVDSKLYEKYEKNLFMA